MMKKLLILSSYYTEVEVVERAKALGYYTIVTDNHTDPLQTPAKSVADEAWNISWTDIDLLERKCRESGISGVLAGFSEFRVESMILLCERLGLPCSLTLEQLEITRDKNKFKRTCEKYAIPCVSEHKYGEVFDFPVIVKPVDRAGSAGITVAYNKQEFEKSYEYALSMSPSKTVIIEDFIHDGVKVDVYYYVKDHAISLLGTSDTIMCKGSEGAIILQKGWSFPSLHEKQYIDEVDESVREMINGLGIDNCYLTMSAFYTKGHIYFFEAGFRLSGEMSFNYYKTFTGVDYLEEMIKFSIGDSDKTVFPQIDYSGKYSMILNFFAKDGTVADITDVDAINEIPEVVDFLIYGKVGQTVANSTKVLKKFAMCTICTTDKNRLASVVSEVNALFSIKDMEGREMIYERVAEEEWV